MFNFLWNMIIMFGPLMTLTFIKKQGEKNKCVLLLKGNLLLIFVQIGLLMYFFLRKLFVLPSPIHAPPYTLY